MSVCSLCLNEIKSDEEQIVVDQRDRHKSCSEEFEKDLEELEKIYSETCSEDI